MDAAKSYFSACTRKKTLDFDELDTKLDRCYGLTDLICMGIGYMVGTGIFILTGEVVRYDAGSAAIFSYLFAGIAATLSAICFAEFAGLVPVAGSGYVYTYVVVGEIWAFTVGWNMVLEYLIGASAAAKAFSGTLDSLCNYSISNGIVSTIGGFGTGSSWLNPYPDFIAFLAILLVTVFVCISAQTTSNFNKVMVVFKLGTIIIIVIAGFTLADIDNWTDPARGGFSPYGAAGVFAGAATCFYAFIGFDGIAIASEETKNPKRNVPIAILASMAIVTFLYIITTIVITLMVPYYEVVVASPFSSAFAQRGLAWAMYVVGIGTMFGLSSVMMSGLYSLPRLLYAMSGDGLLFEAFGVVHEKTKTPLLPIILTGVIAAFLALFLDLTVLVELLSVGTLLSFTFVAACIIILRYDRQASGINTSIQHDSEELPLKENTVSLATYDGTTEVPSESILVKYRKRFRLFLGDRRVETVVISSILIMTFSMVGWLLVFIFAYHDVQTATWWAVLILIITTLGIVGPLLVIASLEPVSRAVTSFKVPLVPLVPAVSIFCNIGLMLMLDPLTWARLVLWLSLGLVLYFVYSKKHSKENKPESDDNDALVS